MRKPAHIPPDNHAPDLPPAAEAFERLRGILAEFGIRELPPAALAAMRVHFETLLRWNRKINLTSVRDPEQILRRHFAESLFLTTLVELGPGLLYDIGSGAGFPGLPLKAACPEMKLVLVESSQKKAAFLKEVIRTAGLEGVRVAAVRVELLEQGRRRDGEPTVELADWITLRAVGGHDELLPVLRRLLVIRGKLALFLGEREAGRLQNAGGFDWQLPVPTPGSERRVILIGEARGG